MAKEKLVVSINFENGHHQIFGPFPSEAILKAWLDLYDNATYEDLERWEIMELVGPNLKGLTKRKKKRARKKKAR